MRSPRISSVIGFVLLSLLVIPIAGCSSPETRAQNFYESGKKLLAEHNPQIAAVQFRNAVSLKKDMLPAWRGLAEAEEANHHWEGLASALQTILELDPKDDTTRLKLARLFLAGGAVDQSLKLANALSEPTANTADALALKAAIFYKLKDHDSALRYAQQAVKIAPGNVDAVLVLAAVQLEQNDATGALNILKQHGFEQTGNFGIQMLKLRIYQQLKDYSNLENLLQELAKEHPTDLSFQKQLVGVYILEHREQDAEKTLRAIAAANPKSPAAVLELVQFLFRTKGPEAARQELVTRINSGTGDVFALQLALAEFDFDQGKADDSFKLLTTLTQSANHDKSIKAKIMLAQLDLRQKKVDPAEKIINDILASDARNVDALKLRATIRLDNGQTDGAIADLREALNDQPNSSDLMLLLASAYERSGSIALANDEYTNAAKDSKYDINIGLNYVAFLRRHGNIDQAYDFLSELVDHHPNSVPVLTAFAELKLLKQDWAGAQQISTRIRKLGNNDAIADQLSGVALGGEQKFDQSIAAFQSAFNASPNATRPMFALVGAMLKAHQTDRALSFLNSVLKDNPNNADARVLLGDVLLLSKKDDQAEDNFKLAIQKQPKAEIGYRALANLYIRQKQYDRALDVLHNGLAEMPKNVMLHMTLAAAFEAEGKYDGAITEYETLIRQDPGSLIVANNLASLLADHRSDKASLDEAKALAERLRDTPVSQFRDTLGWVEYRQGNLKDAAQLVQEAAAVMPKTALVHYHLGMIYLQTGETTKALAELKEALDQQPTADLQSQINTALNGIKSQ